MSALVFLIILVHSTSASWPRRQKDTIEVAVEGIFFDRECIHCWKEKEFRIHGICFVVLDFYEPIPEVFCILKQGGAWENVIGFFFSALSWFFNRARLYWSYFNDAVFNGQWLLTVVVPDHLDKMRKKLLKHNLRTVLQRITYLKQCSTPPQFTIHWLFVWPPFQRIILVGKVEDPLQWTM